MPWSLAAPVATSLRPRGQSTPLLPGEERLGELPPDIQPLLDPCRELQSGRLPRGDGIVRVRREVKGRGGKTVTTISGVPLDDAQLKELGGKLKRGCGTGGSVKNGVIEIQGDHRETLKAALETQGFQDKQAGR